ncbi:DsbA family protein [Salipiger bermudensis]|uniref:27 kDa outer membrane protein, putative n=1 Tax=Salipiger bermudensis (strain DSM 26914 / JCM 13377 / KCTC 12554 / HTCC2601) TaxID=314265 RepID=Q0FP09_SALBH|nr:DsbA family protein [Salipiger bermudensis]EAU45894.1 27 kDa outer membrane protein, putative [Salipiger bermudensis HTCC2601]
MLTRLTRPAAALTLAAGLAAALPATAQDFDFSAMTPEQREAFGTQVREYLLENPQVIMEAVNALENRQAEQQAVADQQIVSDNADALFRDGYSYVGGNPDGDITIVEFSDYRCGYCRRAFPEVEELISSDGNIRFIMKEFPILGEASVTSSRFAIATLMEAGDEAYKAVHDALITLEGEPSEPVLRRLADTLGLDAEAIIARMSDEEVTRRIQETRELATRLQINGTPSFVFGDQMLRGYVPLDGMRQLVDQIRSEG